MSTTSEALAQLANQKSALKVIANRYLPNDEKLDDNCTLQDIIDVMENYDEATYMNAFLNSIEVFPDKDYSINDRKGHIKGLNPYSIYYNAALKSIFLANVSFDTSYINFQYCTNLERLILGGTVYYGDSTVGVNNLRYNTALKHCSFPRASGTLNSYYGGGIFVYNSALISMLVGGNIIIGDRSSAWLPNASFSALIITSSNQATISGTNGATGIINSGCYVYVPSALLSTYQSATNWVTVHQAKTDGQGNYNGIQAIEPNINDLRTLGVDFSLTPYANKKWDGTALVTDSTIGEEVDE